MGWRFKNFPNEIVTEILTRLPTESVLECKLVCKPWRTLISHPSFPQAHLNRLNSADEASGKLSYIFSTYEKQFYYSEYDENSQDRPFSREAKIKLSSPFKDGHYRILGSSNGLICFFNVNDEVAYVCNPVTREYVMLPKFEGEYLLTGFGYSPSTNEYKIASIYNCQRDRNVGIVRVYTLGSVHGWRTGGTIDISTKYFPYCAGVFADGTLHWMDIVGTVVYFHLADEKCGELPSPPLKLSGNRYLRVLGDSVIVTHYYYADGVDIWLLKKNNKDNYDCNWKWSNAFSFDSFVCRPFGFTKSGKLLCYSNHKISSYGPEASSPKMDVSFCKSFDEAILHKNTLVSLKLLGEKDTKTMEVGERACSSKEAENSDN